MKLPAWGGIGLPHLTCCLLLFLNNICCMISFFVCVCVVCGFYCGVWQHPTLSANDSLVWCGCANYFSAVFVWYIMICYVIVSQVCDRAEVEVRHCAKEPGSWRLVSEYCMPVYSYVLDHKYVPIWMILFCPWEAVVAWCCNTIHYTTTHTGVLSLQPKSCITWKASCAYSDCNLVKEHLLLCVVTLDLVYLWLCVFCLLLCSRAQCLTGFMASHVKGTDFTDFFHPADNRKSIHCLKLCMLVCLFVCLSVYLFVCMSLFSCLHMYMYVS